MRGKYPRDFRISGATGVPGAGVVYCPLAAEPLNWASGVWGYCNSWNL